MPAVSKGQWAQVMFAHKAGKKITMKRLAKKVKEFLVGLYETYKEHQKAKETMRKLMALSTRELDDMGIARGDIWSIAHGDTSQYRDRGMV